MMMKDWHKSKCAPYGETTTQVDERKGCFLLAGTYSLYL